MRREARPWLFLHIAKTAGTSFRHGILRRCVQWYEDPYGLNVGEPSIATLPTPEMLESYRNLPKRIKLVAGHFMYDSFRDIFAPDHTMTFFREPVARLVSNYHMSLRHSVHYSKWRALPGEPFLETNPEAFMDFVRLPRVVNYQSRILSGLSLEELGFFGLTEQYRESLKRMKKVVGFAPWYKVRHTRAGSLFKTSSFEVSPEQRREIEELHSDDVALYARAVELFNT